VLAYVSSSFDAVALASRLACSVAAAAGSVFEIPASYLVPRIAAVLGLSGVMWYITPMLTWSEKPATLDPEFVAEAKRIGMVAVRARWGSPLAYVQTWACVGVMWHCEVQLGWLNALCAMSCAATRQRPAGVPEPFPQPHSWQHYWTRGLEARAGRLNAAPFLCPGHCVCLQLDMLGSNLDAVRRCYGL
jgi:hypothetical protein